MFHIAHKRLADYDEMCEIFISTIEHVTNLLILVFSNWLDSAAHLSG